MPSTTLVYAKRPSRRKRAPHRTSGRGGDPKRHVMDTITVDERRAVTTIAWRAGYATYYADRLLDEEVACSWAGYRRRMGWDFQDPHALGEVYMRFREDCGRGWSAMADAEHLLGGSVEG
jgi:hypothetical protein